MYNVGLKVNMMHFPGQPVVRLTIAKIFTENQGFQIVLSIIQKPESAWLGSESFYVLFKTMAEVIFLIIFYYLLLDYIIWLVYTYT
jgi:hypothetical protein